MLVKSISIRNIRSYADGEETRVDIPEGVVLFEGDIGSGKSTLLYAIEFALFGFSDMKGTHLLSEGKQEGRVSVVVESGGKEYTIERKLRAKKEDVSQDDCAISIEGRKERLSPSELKERVVSILGFNEPTHPRAESLVYRYAVFTPQEKMKEILTQDVEDRLHVIRRVLGAQSYQVAAENSAIVERRIEKISYGLQKASEDLAAKRRELKELSEAEELLWSSIPRLEAEAKDADLKVAELEVHLRDLTAKAQALSKIAGRIEPLRESIAGLEERISGDKTEKAELESDLSDDILPTMDRYEATTKPDLTVRELTSKSKALGRKLATLDVSIEKMRSEASERKGLLSKGVCPTCGQPLPHDFESRSEHIDEEIDRMARERRGHEKEASETESELERARGFEELEKDHARASREKGRIEREIGSLARKIEEAEARLKAASAELSKAAERESHLEDVSRQKEEVESDLSKARAEVKRTSERLTRAQAELADHTSAIEKLSSEVARKEKEVTRALRLTEYEDWLRGFFRPTVEQIERQAMSEAAARFNEHFQRFFTTLVDDPDMVVRVREDFSPAFEREGFDQDFEALSGGERTSMALAYRFALNAVVRDNLAAQPELVILDEPTDGFSKEQVYKLRSLLEELDSKQVIMVSHEKELESMADYIFTVMKVNGTSKVSRAGP